MAIAFVNGGRGGNTASASTIATAALSLTASNFTVCAFYIDDSTRTPSGVPTDTAGNTYVQVGTTQQIGGGGGNLCMYAAYNCLGNASNVVTLSLSGASIYRAYATWQFSGLPTSDPRISAVFGSGNSGTSIAASAAASHGAGECVVTALGANFSTAITGGGSGYTFTAFAITGDATQYFGDEYHIVSADETPSETTSSAGVAWGIIAGSFGALNYRAKPFTVPQGQAVRRASYW